jgi:hypothetical protein
MRPSSIIKSISFLLNGHRYRLASDNQGKFPIYSKQQEYPRTPAKYIGAKTAEEIVHMFVDGDPVLELLDLSRVRLCQGNSTEIRIAAISIVESHDAYFKKKRGY